MRHLKSKKVRIVLGAIVAAVVVFGMTLFPSILHAVFDENKAVRFKAFAAKNQIENSTLFIGTYLISMPALTDEIYEKAMDSANDAGQYQIYYKSELANGNWYDITNAENLSEITDSGTPISEGELAELWVTYYVTSDGTVHNAKNGQTVSIFDTPSPYDLYNLPELNAIRLDYENLFSEDSEGVDAYYHDTIRSFFNTNVHNAVTNKCDKQLDALQTCYDKLKQDGNEDEAEIIYKLMSKIDGRRRAEVMSQLAESNSNLLASLQNSCNGEGYSKDNYEDPFATNANVIDAIGESMTSCESSYVKYSGSQLTEGEGTLGKAEYAKSLKVIESAPEGYTDTLSNLLSQLGCIYNIEDDVIKDQSDELAVLEELIPESSNAYQKLLAQGPSDSYRAGEKSGMSSAALGQILDGEKTEVEVGRNDLQNLIRAKTKRMSTADALEFTNTRLTAADGFYNVVQQGDFMSRADDSIASHIIWLKSLAEEIINGDTSLKSKLSELEEKKSELQLAKQTALDNNDLSAANKYEAMIQAVDQDIATEEARVLAELKKTDSSADKSSLESQLGDSTTANNINRLKNQGLSAMMDGDSSKLKEAADGLAALGAASDIQELIDKLPAGASDSMSSSLKSALSDSKNSTLYAQYGGSGTQGSSMTEDQMLSAIEAILGESFDDMDAEGQIKVTVALNWMGRKGNKTAGKLAVTLMQKCVDTDNKYAYKKLSRYQGKDYLALRTVANVTGFRYVYSDSEQVATLIKKGIDYEFSVSSAVVVFADGENATMKEKVEYETEVFVIESACKIYFDCQAEYIANSKYAACLTSQLETGAKEIQTKLQEGLN